MIPLRPALDDYLSVRRALGYKLHRAEKLLANFIDFVEGVGSDRITIDLAISWATQPAQADATWWAGRLSVVRSFATYLHTLDATTEVPPPDLLPRRSHRGAPYLYSDEDIAALVEAAETLSSPLRILTYQTLIPLLAVTGMQHRRGHSPRPKRSRPSSWRAHSTGEQVRQVPRAATPRLHRRGPPLLPQAPGPALRPA